MNGSDEALGVHVPDGLPSWLMEFARDAERETRTLQENGATQAASARTALLRRLMAAAAAWLDAEVDTEEAARESGLCTESIRRAVRNGLLPDRRSNPRGNHRIRRGDLIKLAAPKRGPYDPIADAQDIARLRRKV
jgi:hypothetical protein